MTERTRLGQTALALLQASGLPHRWRGRERFVLLDSDFGCGHVFIEAWRAWRADPERCGRLSVVTVCPRLPTRAELRSVHGEDDDAARCLVQAWPPQTPDLHTLVFEGGRVQLLLAVGDLRSRLPTLRVQADALLARASAIDLDPKLLGRLGRKTGIGATLAIEIDTRQAGETSGPLPADRLQAALRGSGFVARAGSANGVDGGGPGSGTVIATDHAPRFEPRRLPDAAVQGRSAVVVGAGIGGAAVAQALARSGFEVTVLERHSRAAAEASGNPAGLFHAVAHAGNGPYARLYRA
ncbi:MAG: FAD-dependent oxidoreductase, partial [Rubrivivax sp.]